MNKGSFYSAGGYLQLPEKHIKAYVDAFCDEFKRTDTETKLMHLCYAADKGYEYHGRFYCPHEIPWRRSLCHG